MSQKIKKIIFILPALSAGGAERVLITLMNRIDRNKYKPEFISFRRNGHLKQLIANDIIVHDIGSYRQIIRGIIPFIKKLKEINPDVAVTTMAKTNFMLLLVKPFIPNTRIIVREAITPSFMFDTMKLGWLIKLLYKILYPRAHLVISPSKRIIEEFSNLLGMNIGNHKLLYNPVNENNLRLSAPYLKNNLNREKTVHFICAGRMHPQKGFDLLINALDGFDCKYDWVLTILGGGKERPHLENLIKKYNLQNNIFLPGFTQNPWRYIGAADCFLMPSRYEGLPNAVLESLSVGTQVIATKTSGGIQEIANFTEGENIKIVKDMNEFIRQMEKIKPNPTQGYRSSLLPPIFETDNVTDRFMNMIDGKDEFSPKHIKISKEQHKKSKNYYKASQ